MKWEDVEHCTYRSKVPLGWLIKVTEPVLVTVHPEQGPTDGYEWRTSIIFMPDPKHEWII